MLGNCMLSRMAEVWIAAKRSAAGANQRGIELRVSRPRAPPVRAVQKQRDDADDERDVERGRRIPAGLELPFVNVVRTNEQPEIQQ